jgi:hypothetical protein
VEADKPGRPRRILADRGSSVSSAAAGIAKAVEEVRRLGRHSRDGSVDGKAVYIHHGGVSKGAMAWLAVIPEQRMAVALAINTRVWPFARWSGVFFDLVQLFGDSASVESSSAGLQSRQVPTWGSTGKVGDQLIRPPSEMGRPTPEEEISTSEAVQCGHCFVARLRSAIAPIPPLRSRLSHLYPVRGLTQKRAQS